MFKLYHFSYPVIYMSFNILHISSLFFFKIKLDKNDTFVKIRPILHMMNEHWLQYLPHDA